MSDQFSGMSLQNKGLGGHMSFQVRKIISSTDEAAKKEFKSTISFNRSRGSFNTHVVVVVTGDTQEVKNYRPLTFLLTTDKVFEQLFCKQVTVKLDLNFSSLKNCLHQKLAIYRQKRASMYSID